MGPLRFYEDWMPDMMQGMATGITGNIFRVTGAMQKLSGAMTNSMQLGGNDNFASMTANRLRTTLATAASNPPQLNPVPSASAGGGITYEQLLALFNMVIAAIRENGGDIVIGDEYIGRANARYMQDRSIVTGGAVF